MPLPPYNTLFARAVLCYKLCEDTEKALILHFCVVSRLINPVTALIIIQTENYTHFKNYPYLSLATWVAPTTSDISLII